MQGQDHQDLEALLHRHPDHAALIGGGVARFLVATNEFGAPGFVLVRAAGTATAFSVTAVHQGRECSICKEGRSA